MHFHLPKPLHGWREFAGEVGIIVVGVLIALAAEAVVQDIEWRNRVQGSLDALGSDIKDDYFSAAEIVVTQPCVDAQLAQIEQGLSRPGPWRPLPVYVRGPLRFVVRAPVRTWTSNVWQAMNNEGVSSHIDRPLRLGIEAFFTTTAYLSAQQSDAAKLNWGLTALGQQAAPDAGQRFQLIRDIEQMRGNFQLLKVVANQALGRVDSLGIGNEDPAKLQSYLTTSGTVAFCRERHLPLGNLQPIAPTDIK